MASGKTLELNAGDRKMDYRPPVPWVQKARDRSLRGKARIKARKAEQRAERA